MALQLWFQRAAQNSESNEGSVIAGAAKVLGLTVSRDEWQQAAEHVATGGGRLQALWASRDREGRDIVRVAFIADQGVLMLSLEVPGTEVHYPSIEQWFPSANRMQRAVADLSGLRSTDPDTRPWLRHAAWPESFHPLIDAHAPTSPSHPGH